MPPRNEGEILFHTFPHSITNYYYCYWQNGSGVDSNDGEGSGDDFWIVHPTKPGQTIVVAVVSIKIAESILLCCQQQSS